MQKPIVILGIESSCDDTAAAVMRDGKILSNIVANQKIHEQYGGVVPELASRAHQQNIVPVVNEALKLAGINKHDLSAIAFTNGPGLMGSLLVGASFAKGMAMALNIPLIEVNHMQAHVLAHFIDKEKQPSFPFLCLTVSGGHTQIVRVNDFFEMQLIGETTDDAAGECFDKAAKILGLPYPGGPLVDKYAQLGNATKYKFPHPKVPEYNFSFSGLKTAFMNFVQNNLATNPNFITENLNDICASLQKTIVDILMDKLLAVAEETKTTNIAIAGGVSANSGLRKAILNLENNKKYTVFIPKFEYCTDNAAMIAIVGHYKFLNNTFTAPNSKPTARWSV